MEINKNMMEILELQRFKDDLKNIENQYLDLIYDPFFKCVCERCVYEKHIGCMEWKCAICGNDIIIDRRKNDPENFVCFVEKLIIIKVQMLIDEYLNQEIQCIKS